VEFPLVSSRPGPCPIEMPEAIRSQAESTNTRFLHRAVALAQSRFAMTPEAMCFPTIRGRIEDLTSTTKLEITMTTNLHQELSRDLQSNGGWPLFSVRQRTLKFSEPVCAFTVSWSSPDFDLDELARRARIGLAHRIHVLSQSLDCAVRLFFINVTRQPKSATVLHRKIWKLPALGGIPAEVQRKPEVVIDCGSHVRFASTAIVPGSSLAWLVSVHAQFDLAIPVLLPKSVEIHDHTPLEWAKVAMPPDACRSEPDFEWPEFAGMVAGMGGVCVRQTNDLATGTIDIDFFTADKAGETLAQAITEDDELSQSRWRDN
jgi:hypothetical protein